MLRPAHLLACLPLLLPAPLWSQPPVDVERGELRRLTTDDGLPQGLVRDILQDRQGYLWFSTKDGLARSDGYSMTVFRHDDLDSTTISGNHATYLLEDSAGYLWVGVKGVGMDRYDPFTQRFTPTIHGPGVTPAYMDGLEIIVEGAQGELWTVSEEDLLSVIVNGDGPAPTAMLPREAYPSTPFLKKVNAAECDGRNGLWMVGMDTLRYVQLHGSGPLRHKDWTVAPPRPDDEGSYHGHELAALPDQRRMLAFLSTMVVIFDDVLLEPIDTLHLPAAHPFHRLGLVDRDGYIWYSDKQDRCCRLSLADGRVTEMDLRCEGQHAKTDLFFTFFHCQDNMGNLWAGTGGLGALKLTWSSRLFSAWPYEGDYRTDLIGYEVLGHSQFGLFASPKPGRSLVPSVPDRRYCFDCIFNGAFWLGGIRDPLGRTWGIRTYGDIRPPELGRVDTDGTMMTVAVDLPGMRPQRALPGHGDDLWLLVGPDADAWRTRSELVRFNTRTERTSGRYPLPRPLSRREYWTVSQWSLTPDGTIWIGTIEGLLHFDPGTGAFTEYRHDPSDTTSLPDNMVFSLCPDPKEPRHVLWVGTEGRGMARLDARTGKCIRIGTREGLPNNVIYGILPDQDGDLVLSTNVGLVLFDIETRTSLLFTSEDGLPGNEFNRYGSALGPDGRMYFEGTEGGVMFDPGRLKPPAREGHTRIAEVLDMNSPLPVTIIDGSVWTSVERQEALILPYDTRMLTLGFSVMDHTAPAKNQYRYRMSGLYEEWVQNGASNRATFTNLDPGHYTFQVQGRNSAGVWDKEGATLSIVITPPWWGTWWFRSLVVLAVAGLLYAFYRYRLARALEVVSVRDRIARDLHDEIGSTLSSVALYSTVARNKAGDRVPEANAMLDRITESTTEVMEAMNDIVWAVNSKNDDMAQVVQRMRAFGVAITEAAGMQLKLEVEPGVQAMTLDMAQRRDLYLIFKEAVNNAVKYGQAGTVRVSLARAAGRVQLVVEDDGVGFEPDAPSSNGTGGNGLPNMRRRAREMGGELTIASVPGTGTRISLRFDPRNRKSLDRMTSDGRDST